MASRFRTRPGPLRSDALWHVARMVGGTSSVVDPGISTGSPTAAASAWLVSKCVSAIAATSQGTWPPKANASTMTTVRYHIRLGACCDPVAAWRAPPATNTGLSRRAQTRMSSVLRRGRAAEFRRYQWVAGLPKCSSGAGGLRACAGDHVGVRHGSSCASVQVIAEPRSGDS